MHGIFMVRGPGIAPRPFYFCDIRVDPADPNLSPWQRSLAHNGPYEADAGEAQWQARERQRIMKMLDEQGIAVRVGHHCAQPLMRILGTVATARASFYVYNDTDDVDQLIFALKEARKYFGFANGSPR